MLNGRELQDYANSLHEQAYMMAYTSEAIVADLYNTPSIGETDGKLYVYLRGSLEAQGFLEPELRLILKWIRERMFG